MQNIWRKCDGWDEKTPEKLFVKWRKWIKELVVKPKIKTDKVKYGELSYEEVLMAEKLWYAKLQWDRFPHEWAELSTMWDQQVKYFNRVHILDRTVLCEFHKGWPICFGSAE